MFECTQDKCYIYSMMPAPITLTSNGNEIVFLRMCIQTEVIRSVAVCNPFLPSPSPICFVTFAVGLTLIDSNSWIKDNVIPE